MNEIKNEVQVFENIQFGKLRVIEIDGKPWVIGKDVAEMLGYSNSRKALADHVDGDDRMDGVTIRDSIGRNQTPVLINESGLYSLIFSSKLPEAKKFKRWVTSEVLPAIRKTGGYVADGREQEFIENNKMIQKELQELRLTVTALQNQLTPTPDAHMQNMWKYYNCNPIISELADSMGIDYRECLDAVYEHMTKHFGFNKTVAVREYQTRYRMPVEENVSVITAVSDNPVYRKMLIQSANEVMSNINMNHTITTPTTERNITAKTINKTVRKSSNTTSFTLEDSVDSMVSTIASVTGDKTVNNWKTYKTIYERITTKSAWKRLCTTHKCANKKEVIMTDVKYKKLFVKISNEIMSEQTTEVSYE